MAHTRGAYPQRQAIRVTTVLSVWATNVKTADHYSPFAPRLNNCCVVLVNFVLCTVFVDCIALCIVYFKCVLYYCHRGSTHLQLNIYIIS
jgi:hypothetical protein